MEVTSDGIFMRKGRRQANKSFSYGKVYFRYHIIMESNSFQKAGSVAGCMDGPNCSSQCSALQPSQVVRVTGSPLNLLHWAITAFSPPPLVHCIYVTHMIGIWYAPLPLKSKRFSTTNPIKSNML